MQFKRFSIRYIWIFSIILLLLGYAYLNVISNDISIKNNNHKSSHISKTEVCKTDSKIDPKKDSKTEPTIVDSPLNTDHKVKSKKIMAEYQCKIDENNIEVKIDKQPMIFTCKKFETSLEELNKGDAIELTYYVNSQGQFEILKLVN